MEMKMTTTTTVQQIRDAVKMIKTGRATFNALLAGLTDNERALVQAFVEADDEVLSAPAEVPAAPVSNESRMVGVAPAPAVVKGDRPNVKNAIIHVLKDNGGTMSADDIFAEIEKRGWVPEVKNPRAYVGHTLSTLKDVFLRDKRKGRGFYKLANGVEPKATTNGDGKRIIDTPAKVENATPKIIKLLQKTRAPFSIGDVSKAAKIPNHRQVNALVMTLLKRDAVTKLRKKSESGQSLFEVNRKEFNKFVEGLA